MKWTISSNVKLCFSYHHLPCKLSECFIFMFRQWENEEWEIRQGEQRKTSRVVPESKKPGPWLAYNEWAKSYGECGAARADLSPCLPAQTPNQKSWVPGQAQVTVNSLSWSRFSFPDHTADDLTPFGVPNRLKSLYHGWKIILSKVCLAGPKISQTEREREDKSMCVCFSKLFTSFWRHAGFLHHNTW